MGAPSFEASLRRRLLLLVGPTLVAVGVASVMVTSRALKRADRDAARARAAELLRQLDIELNEGDAPEAAAREVLGNADADGARATIRGGTLAREYASATTLPSALAVLHDGACASADDEGGHPWIACASARGGVEAIVALPVEAHRAVVRTLAESMLAVVALAILAAIAATRLAARRPIASLQRLVDWSERVAARDKPPAPPPADTIEVERLTASFDALVKRLVEALARERATSAHIAHELRTPLTAMRAELEAMGESGGERAVRILGDVERLGRVIDAILVLSSPSAPAKGEGVVNVADVVRELARDETSVDAPDEALVDADPRLVELALVNLLENAKKYSGHPARAVRVSRAPGGVRVAVIDDGPGLDEAARARMFDRYWRGTAENGGSGLGLALVQAVAERYDGHADARPNEGGRGLEVAITFGHLLGWHSEAKPR
jgi:signal transduction histidine kinase